MAGPDSQHVLTRIVSRAEDGRRLDSLLRFELGLSRRSLRTLKAFRGLEVNGEEAYASQLVKAGDVVDLWFPAVDSAGVSPEDMAVETVFEDEHVVVVNKPPGMVTHPVKHYQSGTLANGVAYHLASRGEPARSHPVNRLDKDTSGLVVFAKHPPAHEQLVSQMESGRFRRTYVALVVGIVDAESGVIDLPIAEREDSLPGRTVAPGGKAAVTNYSVLERLDAGCTLLRVQLQSGRTHQIRVHFSAIGHPLVGDTLYAVPGEGPVMQVIARQALHAGRLEFTKPFSDEPITLSVPIPPDMEAAIARCRHRRTGAPDNHGSAL